MKSEQSSGNGVVPSTQPKFSFSYRPDIDGMRALAVFAVFVFHAFPEYLKGGFVGVDIFFVISGFLISSIIYVQLSNENFSFWGFYSRRIRRIYPVLIVVLVACLLFGWYFMTCREFAQLGKHAAGGAAFISNYILRFEGGYFDNEAATKVLLHFWSLAVEEQFYIIWPFLLWAAWKRRINLFIVCLVIAVISFGWDIRWLLKEDFKKLFFLPQSRFWELLSGAMLAWVCLFKKEQFQSLKASVSRLFSKPSNGRTNTVIFDNILSVAGLGMLIASVFVSKEHGFPGYQALLPVGGSVLLIAAGENGWLNKHILGSKILVWFGLISYPMYLWHWPILTFARIETGEAPSFLYGCCAFVVCVVLAWLTTRFVERPLRFGDYGKTKTIGLFCVMVAIGFAGLGIYKAKGVLSRFPKELQTDQLAEVKLFKTNPPFWNACNTTVTKSWKNDCKDKPHHPTKPTVVFWGDSHMAGFVPEIRRRIENNFNVFQRTSPGCPRFTQIDVNADCREKTQFILKELANQNPDYLVWSIKWVEDSNHLERIKPTIEHFKSLGVKNIIVLGPTPEWKLTVPKLVTSQYLSNKKDGVPTHLMTDSDKSRNIDELLARELPKLNVHYVSMYKEFCDGNVCRIREDGENGKIYFFDADHVTDAGVQYMVPRILKQLPFQVAPPQ